MDLRNTVALIKDQVDLRQYIPDVKKYGSNWMCSCPFHSETNPSMVIHDRYYLCFGCGATGDILTWLQSPQGGGYSFMEALSVAALEANVTLEDDLQQQVQQMVEERDKRAEELAYYQSKLPDSDKAMKYLTGNDENERGLTEEVIKHFGLGYSPKDDAIAIPVFSKSNALEALTLRYLNPNGPMKYKHEQGWQKKGIFYNAHALEFGEGPVYICEGMFDVHSLHQAGFTRSVAILGSGLADDHIKQINGAPIVFVPDRVKEGDFDLFRKAVFRARRAFPEQVIKAAILPAGHDANSAGVEALQEAVKNAECAELAILKADLDTCTDAETEYAMARKVASDIKDPLTKDDVIRWLAKRWDKERDVIKQGLSRGETAYSRVTTMAEALEEMEESETQAEIEGLGIRGLGIEKYIDRPRTGQIAIIAARPSVGKTLFALNVMYNNNRDRIPTLFVTQEQPPKELAYRLSLMLTGDLDRDNKHGVNNKMLRHQIIQNSDWWKYHKTALIDMFPHIRFERRRLSAQGLRDAVVDASYSMGEAVKTVFVDYFGLLKDDERSSSEYQRASNVARGIQDVTQELQFFNMILSQVTRAGGDGTERLSYDMSRDSGVIEEVADYWAGLWRAPLAENEEHKKSGIEKIIGSVSKNRHGQTGDFTLWKNMSTLRLLPTDYRPNGYDKDTGEVYGGDDEGPADPWG